MKKINHNKVELWSRLVFGKCSFNIKLTVKVKLKSSFLIVQYN